MVRLRPLVEVSITHVGVFPPGIIHLFPPVGYFRSISTCFCSGDGRFVSPGCGSVISVGLYSASLPCTGPDLLSIDQSNRYICLASQCTQRMETHFCLALANQEAHFCLALLSIAPQRSALQRSYTHTHGFCTP